MDLTAFYSQFRDETAENLRILNEGLLALESSDLTSESRREYIDAIFRAMHTIKGSARLLGFEDAARVAHTCEHILSAVREGQRQLDQNLSNDLMRGGDTISDLVNAAIEGRTTDINVEQITKTLGRSTPPDPPQQAGIAEVAPPQPVGEQAPAQPVTPITVNTQPDSPPPQATTTRRTTGANSRQTIRVRVDRLDRLLNLVGELAVGRQAQLAHLQTLEEVEIMLAQQERTLLALNAELRKVRFSPLQREALNRYMNELLNVGDTLNKTVRSQVDRFSILTTQATQLIEDLEQDVLAARLLPASMIFTNLPRAVRELSHSLAKEIALTIEGEATELDRKVIEALGDPLLHLVRNAVDHGIEAPEERERAGKLRQGHIQVSARAVGSHVHVIIRDDGRGMDPQHLRETAVRKKLMSYEAAMLLTDQDAIELIFTPGFTTAPLITDVSGRGVGMDIVRTNVMEIGGQIQIESRLDMGTTITLVLPLTLATTRVLLIELGEHIFALPVSGCQGSIWAYPDQVQTIEGRAMLPHQGRLIPLLRLADLLDVAGANPFPSHYRTPTLLIGTSKRPLALLVDRVLDEREAVVKPLGVLMERQRRYSGAVQLGDGRLILLLNPTMLVQTARGMGLSRQISQLKAERHARLLVVDDSFTTRELIRSILQSSGYDVTTAVDGFDALDKLRAGAYDLVVSDVEMPRIDGFQLTMSIRSELRLTELPVVIVTSLASEAHRRRGLEVGAQAYIVKSQFDQSNLLETVRQLLGS